MSDYELDESDLINFENEDKYYEKFYKSKVEYVNLVFLYLDLNGNIVHTKNYKQVINNNKITKELLIHILNKNSKLNKIRYKTISILKYNIDLEPEKVRNYIEKNDNLYDYIDVTNYLDDIVYNDSIMFLKDLNSLHIIFYPKKNKIVSTKKIYIKKNRKNKTRKRV
tara:strand:- start:3741 stop:4241 length:501 start_codon:yes stop_codon:yes gene_type:complete